MWSDQKNFHRSLNTVGHLSLKTSVLELFAPGKRLLGMNWVYSKSKRKDAETASLQHLHRTRQEEVTLLSKKNMHFGKNIVAASLLSMVFLVAGAPRAHADEHDRCRRHIEKAEHRLDEAIRHHGEHSPEARERRHELYEEREHCWREQHGWWDGHDQRWHEERWEEEHERDR